MRADHGLTSAELVLLKELIERSRHKKFWNDYPLLISLFAFLLALMTTIISAYFAYQKDMHDQISELSGAIRTIQELNLRQVELTEKYQGTRYEGRTSALITNQIYNTNIIAADIAFRIGTHATTATIIPISEGLFHYGQYTRAEKLAQIGLDAARTAEDETTALRWLGSMKIQEGSAASIEQGNQFFLRAYQFEQKYGQMRSPDTAAFIKAGVQLQWADALARFNCKDALSHFYEAISILNSAGRNIDLDRLRSGARNKILGGIGQIESCKPSPDSSSVVQ